MIAKALASVTVAMVMALCGVAPANAQQRTAEQIKADVDLEALAWFQPDMTQEDLAAVEANYNCALKSAYRKPCSPPPHPLPPDVLRRVAAILHEAKSIYAAKGRQAFEVWVTLENRRAEAAYARAYHVMTPVNQQ